MSPSNGVPRVEFNLKVIFRYYLNDLTYREDPPREEKRRKRKTRRRRRKRKNRRNRVGAAEGLARRETKKVAGNVANQQGDADGGAPFAEPTG